MDEQDLEREYADAFDDDMKVGIELEPGELGDDADDGDEGDELPTQDVAKQPEPAAPQAEAGQEGGGSPDGAAVVSTGQQAPADDEIEKERQRLRSWEGRLKAREAELSKKGGEESPAAEATEDRLEAVADATGSTELKEAAQAAAEAVEAGDISPDEAMRQLSEDFGDEFISLIQKVVVATARKELAPVASKADQAEKAAMKLAVERHYSAIESKHPDFREVNASPEFDGYLKSLPEAQRQEAERIRQSGTAQEIVKMLDSYKGAAKAKQAPAQADTPKVDTAAMESIEGVRSGGVRLPEKPASAKDDFEGAWNDF